MTIGRDNTLVPLGIEVVQCRIVTAFLLHVAVRIAPMRGTPAIRRVISSQVVCDFHGLELCSDVLEAEPL